mmetsp:Transcript_21684/g.29067  ORF Transcript_21684/g.29067 Transcript_21684/m.29067 type:complete len:126 (+) Transcript_21684:443-820(+)
MDFKSPLEALEGIYDARLNYPDFAIALKYYSLKFMEGNPKEFVLTDKTRALLNYYNVTIDRIKRTQDFVNLISFMPFVFTPQIIRTEKEIYNKIVDRIINTEESEWKRIATQDLVDAMGPLLIIR